MVTAGLQSRFIARERARDSRSSKYWVFLASFEAGPLGIPSGGIFGPFLAVFLVGGGPKWISGFVT